MLPEVLVDNIHLYPHLRVVATHEFSWNDLWIN